MESDRAGDTDRRQDRLRTLSDNLFGEAYDGAGLLARPSRTPWPDDPGVRRAIKARVADRSRMIVVEPS